MRKFPFVFLCPLSVMSLAERLCAPETAVAALDEYYQPNANAAGAVYRTEDDDLHCSLVCIIPYGPGSALRFEVPAHESDAKGKAAALAGRWLAAEKKVGKPTTAPPLLVENTALRAEITRMREDHRREMDALVAQISNEIHELHVRISVLRREVTPTK